MDTFWQHYTELAAVVYPPLTPTDGVEDSILLAAEARLGVLLPRRLRECYLLTGKRSDMHRSLDVLLPPQELKLASETIIFYLENQGVVVWGIRIADAHLEDPPVYLAANESRLVWELAWDHLSGFLHFMLLWQAMGVGQVTMEWHQSTIVPFSGK